MSLIVWTVGHSTLSFAEFLAMLEPHGIEAIADIRRFPGSRRHPQFNEPALRDALAEHGIAYSWIAKLGGRRSASDDSVNLGWKNPAFRAYADYLASAEFTEGLAELLELAKGRRTAMMCSEILWWRCHRRLVADVLVTRGVQVVHILSTTKSQRHELAPPARLVDGRLTYPGAPSDA